MIPILFWPVLVLTCGYALYRGGVHERAVALVCILATLVSINIHPSIGRCRRRLNVRRLMYQSLIWFAALGDDARRLRAPTDAERMQRLANALVDRVR